MEPVDPILHEYERQLRRSLAGLPRPEVDVVVADVMSALRSEAENSGSALAALKAVGTPHRVGAALVTSLVRPDDAPALTAVPVASRVAALAVDALIAWGASAAALAAAIVLGSAGALALLVPAAAIAVAWGTWYWRGPRRRGTSAGLRAAGLKRLAIGEERVTVRTRDLAQALARTPLRAPTRSR